MADEQIQQVYKLSAFQVSDDQLLGALKLKKEENSRERVPSMIKIQRVPEIIRRSEDFEACYKPMELSIGPIHASYPNLIKMELKVRLAAEFIKDSNQREEDLLLRIKENIQDLKKFFNEEVINSYECWARIWLLDGCAALQFIFSFLDECLRSVSFRTYICFRGHLKLPPLVVDGSTTRKLLNLLAYEMCRPDYETDSIVASYVSLLDLLIDNGDDVKDLRAADIIRNHLSSDVEVAKLFNSLGSMCIAPSRDIYKDVKSGIEKHYKRKFVIWMAQVYHDHLSSPWTILALLAAITILVLTATQPYYAIHPKN